MTFEYKMEKFPFDTAPADIVVVLNALGADGWEVIDARSDPHRRFILCFLIKEHG